MRVLDNNTAEKAAELDNLLKQKNQLIEIINKIPEKENIFTTPTLGDTDDKVDKAKRNMKRN